MRNRSTAVIGTLGLAMLVSTTAHAQTIVPQPFPSQVNFPLPTATVQQWIASSDNKAMRGHAWDLWTAMALPSGQIYLGVDLPIWETWYGTEDVFRTGQTDTVTALLSFTRPPRSLRAFTAPKQFSHHRPGSATLAGPADNVQTRIVSFNKFNPDAAAFIVKAQPGPGSQTFVYSRNSSLMALNAAWPAGTSGQARGINEFPSGAIELKPVFARVKATGLTAQPLWQGPSGSTNAANPTPNTWTTCVLVDPAGQTGLRPATAQEIASAQTSGLACKTFLYGPLSLFYSFRLSADNAQAFASASGAPANQGDYAVLTAMHVTTKEIPFWTWQTFWWQPGGDTPNGFPGSKAGQPANLASPWNNYASCTNYDQTTMPGGKTMDVCFNPYLETSPGIPAGISSNCMSCHGTARVSTGDTPYPADYKAPIAFFTDPTYYNSQSTHTDFSWAVADAP